MKYPDNAVPLIVVGRPRAGTRFLVGALNKFPEITIQGELPNPVMDQVEGFIDGVDAYYERAALRRESSEQALQYWREKKTELIFSIWANAGQSKIVKPHKECRYFGYKRPNNEFRFSFYEKHFHDRKPVYIYCCRNFTDNYLSISSRWPDRKIRRVADEYVASIRQYWHMKQAAPDRVFAFLLDEYTAKGIDHMKGNVLDQLDIEQSARVLKAIAQMTPKNTTEGLGVERRRVLTKSEQRYIKRRSDLRAEFEKLVEKSSVSGA